MKTQILNKIPKLNKAVENFSDNILDAKFLDIKSNIYSILEQIDKLELISNKLVEKSKKIVEYQKTLDMDISRFENVE